MKRIVFIVLLVGLAVPTGVFGQGMFSAGKSSPPDDVPPPILSAYPDTQSLSDLNPDADLPVMAPELALATYQQKSAMQSSLLEAYSAVTVIHAELPDTSQQGE